MPTESTEIVEAGSVQTVAVMPTAIEAIERANIDIQIVTAHKFPRSLDRFYKTAKAMVTVDEETAKSCMYTRPVGKSASGQVVYAKGESVRLAEMVAASYQNLRIGAVIVETNDPMCVKAIGFGFDLEANYAVKVEVVEPTVKKNGKPYDQRMRILTEGIAQSKAIRNATFRVVPKSLCKPIIEAARKVAQGDAKTFEARKQGVVDWIKSLAVKPERVWAAIRVKGADDIGFDELMLLAGIKNALDDRETTVDDAFPKLAEDQPQGTAAERIKGAAAAAQPTPPATPPAEPESTPTGEIAPAPQRSRRGRKPGSKNKSKAEAPAGTPPPPDTEPAPEPEPAPAEQQAADKPPVEDGAESEKESMFQCIKCDRISPASKLVDGTKCQYCFGKVEQVS